jgi:hypothetical protein
MKPICIAVLFFVMAIRPAPAEYAERMCKWLISDQVDYHRCINDARKWKTEHLKCYFSVNVPKNDPEFPNEMVTIDKDAVSVVLRAENIAELEEGIAMLKKCNAFWKCVYDRDHKKKVKHCYENDRRWR